MDGETTKALVEVLHSAAVHWPRFNADHAWRALDAETARAWLAQLPPRIDDDSQQSLRACAVLRSRQPETVLRVWCQAFAEGLDPDALYWLMEVGYAEEDS